MQTGDPGDPCVRELIARFTTATSAAPRHQAAHQFARVINDGFLKGVMQGFNWVLQETDTDVPHQPLRDNVWVDFTIRNGLSDEDLQLAKKVYAYFLRTCAFCGSKTAPLATCSSWCMEVRYCIGTDCQMHDWSSTPREESHRALCARSYVLGSRGRTRVQSE